MPSRRRCVPDRRVVAQGLELHLVAHRGLLSASRPSAAARRGWGCRGRVERLGAAGGIRLEGGELAPSAVAWAARWSASTVRPMLAAWVRASQAGPQVEPQQAARCDTSTLTSPPRLAARWVRSTFGGEPVDRGVELGLELGPRPRRAARSTESSVTGWSAGSDARCSVTAAGSGRLAGAGIAMAASTSVVHCSSRSAPAADVGLRMAAPPAPRAPSVVLPAVVDDDRAHPPVRGDLDGHHPPLVGALHVRVRGCMRLESLQRAVDVLARLVAAAPARASTSCSSPSPDACESAGRRRRPTMGSTPPAPGQRGRRRRSFTFRSSSRRPRGILG